MRLTLTLAQIRAHSPCASGWSMLLASLGGQSVTLDTVVSLGDIARSNGARDALWCVRCLDWEDVAVRRAVIGALLPTLGRAAAHTADARVHDCIAAVRQWAAGDDSVDLRAAAGAAAAAYVAYAADAADAAYAADAADAAYAAYAADVAYAAADAAAYAAAYAARAADAADAAYAAAYAAALAAYAATQNDLIAAFPPLHAQQ